MMVPGTYVIPAVRPFFRPRLGWMTTKNCRLHIWNNGQLCSVVLVNHCRTTMGRIRKSTVHIALLRMLVLRSPVLVASLVLMNASTSHSLVASEPPKKRPSSNYSKKPSLIFFRQASEESDFFGKSIQLQQILSEPSDRAMMRQVSIPAGPSSIRYRGGFCQEIVDTPSPSATDKESFWQTTSQRLVRLANLASILCVIDCTVLPIVTILFPLLGMAAPGHMEWLHEFGHSVAIFFVLPGKEVSISCSFYRPSYSLFHLSKTHPLLVPVVLQQSEEQRLP